MSALYNGTIIQWFLCYQSYKIMVPLSEARHRIYQSEMSEVIQGLRMRLEKHIQDKTDSENAEICFRVLYRLAMNSKGRPKYPEFSWKNLRLLLDQYVPELQ